MRGSGQAGVSVLEIIVASAVLMIIALQIASGFDNNMQARTRSELSREFLAVETALRGATFKKVSALMETGLDCAKPEARFKAAWTAQSYQGVRFRLLENTTTAKHPKNVARRCKSQSHKGAVGNGLYFCLEVLPGAGGAPAKSFLAKHDVYAEAFYGLWDVTNDRGVACTAFNDSATPLRAGKLFYTLYWRSKKAEAGADFQSQTGTMYGQSKKP